MSNIYKSALKSCMVLGLNIKTGNSPDIPINKLEQVDNNIHTSNGARIVRDDKHPWNLFNIERNYINGSLYSLKFCGYKNKLQREDEIIEDIQRLNRKVISLNENISELIEELKYINSYKTATSQDIIDFLNN